MRLLLEEDETAGASPLATCDAPRGAAKVVIRDTDGISGPPRGRTGAGRDQDVLSCPVLSNLLCGWRDVGDGDAVCPLPVYHRLVGYARFSAAIKKMDSRGKRLQNHAIN